jgi:hypothetical protein
MVSLNRGVVTLSILVFLAGVIAYLPEFFFYKRLARQGTSTVGRILEVQPKEHLRAVYTFEASGKSVTKSTTGYTGHVGDIVRVYYLPTEPLKACVCSPNDAAAGALLCGAEMGIFLGFACACTMTIRARRSRRADAHRSVSPST